MKVKSKSQTTQNALRIAASHIVPCIKLRLDNIVFPKWSDIGLWGQILAMKVKTKEQPLGCDYDEVSFQIVMRVLNGKVLMTGGRPDSYTWTTDKVKKYLDDPESIRYIGVNSAAALINLAKVINTIPDEDEQKMFADMFCSINKDLLLITSEEENRRCIEVTQELYDAGLTYVVDSWMEPDKVTGEYTATLLNVGDFIIVEGPEKIYCIRKDEFNETHKLA